MPWPFSTRRRREKELREEIEFDIERETLENQRAGLDPSEARDAARKAFGNVTLAQESTREVWGRGWLERLVQDLRFALRTMRKNSGFTLAVVLSIALGIGVNTAMFSIIRGVLLDPLEFRDSGRLVEVWEHPSGGVKDRAQMSGPDFNDFRDQSVSFEHLAAYIPSFTFQADGFAGPILVRCAAFSPEFFETFGLWPIAGTIYEPRDYHREATTVLISYGFWQRQFGGDRQIVGKTFSINHVPSVIIGVMPPTRDLFANVDLFMTYVPDYPWAVQRGNKFLNFTGLLKPGVSIARAREEMQAIYRRMPGVAPNATIEVLPIKDEIVQQARPALLVLTAAVFLVLLVTCANVGNLLLAHGAARQKEIVTRLALGASRGRIVCQFVTESIAFAAFGGALGIVLASWLVGMVVKSNPGFLPRISSVRIDFNVLLFGLAASLLAAICFGLAPALAAGRMQLHDRLRSGRGEANAGGRTWTRGALVASELAMAVILLVGAGLLIRSFARLMSVKTGFRPDHLLTLGIRATDRDANVEFYSALLDRLGSRPTIDSAGVSDCGTGYVPTADVLRPDAANDPNRIPVADACWVSPGYFDSMGIALIKGRKLDQRDGANAPPTAVISASMAEQLWPGEDPLGKRIAPNYRSLGRPTDEVPVTREVVGIVADARLRGLETPARMAIYLPYQQDSTHRSLRSMVLYVRSKSDPHDIAGLIRGDLRAIGPDIPIPAIRSMQEVISQALAPRTFTLALLGAFAGLALSLAAIGLYGVVAYSVARRTREIGIRMALGASKQAVLRIVIAGELRWLGAGLFAGLAGALSLSRFLSGLLFGVSTTDAFTYAGVLAVLTAVAIAAVLTPARKAARVDPLLALREE